MKVLFDTSVLVAALEASHARHQEARRWLERAKNREFEFLVAAHTLAECYAVLTTYPVRPRFSPREILQLLEENILGHAQLVALSVADYTTLVKQLAALNVSGGTIYEAVLVAAGRKENADLILTLNPGHFLRVWPEGAEKIREP